MMELEKVVSLLNTCLHHIFNNYITLWVIESLSYFINVDRSLMVGIDSNMFGLSVIIIIFFGSN